MVKPVLLVSLRAIKISPGVPELTEPNARSVLVPVPVAARGQEPRCRGDSDQARFPKTDSGRARIGVRLPDRCLIVTVAPRRTVMTTCQVSSSRVLAGSWLCGGSLGGWRRRG